MLMDKSLSHIDAEALRARVAAGQAINLRELSAFTGFSYSIVRRWLDAGLLMIDGRIFHDDFVEWRRRRTGLTPVPAEQSAPRRHAGRQRQTSGKSDGSLATHG